jgi:hypothetical protein
MNDERSKDIIPAGGREIDHARFAPPDAAPPAPPPAEAMPQITIVRSGNRGCGILALGVTGCLLMVAAGVLVLLLTGAVTVGGLINSFQLGPLLNTLSSAASGPAQAVVDPARTILNGIQPLGQLVSVSAQLAAADVRVSVAQGALNACGFSANHVAEGAIEAGIDLTGVSEDDIRFDAATDTYTIRVPYPTLTSCRIDDIRQYERSFTTCNVDWDEARRLAGTAALGSFRDEALEGGILERAASDARLVLGNFVQVVSGANVRVEFEPPPAEAALPASCVPQAPAGWLQDPASGVWSRPG